MQFYLYIFAFLNHFSQASKVSCLCPGSVTDSALIVYYTYTTLFTFHPATHHLNTTFRWTWVCEAAHSPTQWRVNPKVTLTHWLECLCVCLSVLRIVDASTVQQITFKRPTNCHLCFTKQTDLTNNRFNYVNLMLTSYIDSLSLSLSLKEEVMLAEENKNSGRSALDGMNFILTELQKNVLSCVSCEFGF